MTVSAQEAPTIVHATDLHDASYAFEHCVALAQAARARLISLHANAADSATERMRDAAPLLREWGLPARAVAFEKRVHRCCDDPVETILDALRSIEPDLVVATTHHRNAVARFFAGSRAEAIAHNVTTPVLLLSDDARPFVDPTTGDVRLHRLLVPIGDGPAAAAAVHAAAWLARLSRAPSVEFVLLHVGATAHPPLDELEQAGWTHRERSVETGDVVDAILAHADSADAIVMATRGHDSLADVLLGSHTDRVLHAAKRPVLSVGVHG